jgi:hypothetical protein
MSEDTATPPEVDPILTNDQSGTDTSMPLLPPNIAYRCKVVKIEQVRNKADTGNILKIQLGTMDETTSVSGEQIRPNYPIFDMIALTPTPNYSVESINKALKRFMVGCGEPEGSFYPYARFIGKVVKVKLKVTKATDEYDEQNKVKSYEEPAAE